MYYGNYRPTPSLHINTICGNYKLLPKMMVLICLALAMRKFGAGLAAYMPRIVRPVALQEPYLHGVVGLSG